MGFFIFLFSLDLSSFSWSIIGYMYKAKYDAYVKEVIEGAFETTKIQALYTTYQSLIEDFVISEEDGYTFLESSADFQSAVSTLKSHASSRAAAVSNYLN